MIKLSPSQLKVVEEFPGFLSNDDTEMTISGFAGSGKSFLVKYLADTCKKQEKVLRMIDRNQPVRKIHFTATTNKAAAVLQEMLGSKRYVQTIHKLLGLVVYNDRRTGKQKLVLKERTTNLSRSIVFIDEASMINYELLTIIRKLQKRFLDCKIVFIGDAYQLPPVLENVCPVFDPNATNVFFLKEIQRQLANNPIIQLSAKYRDVLDDHKLGWPTIPHDGKHIFYYPEQKPFCDQISSVYTQFHDPNDYKILAWSNDRVRSYNRWIRQLQGMTKPFQVGEVMVSNKPLCIGGALVDSTDSLQIIVSVEPVINDGIKGYYIGLKNFPDEIFFQPGNWREATALARKRAAIAKQTEDWSDYFEITQNWTDLRPVHSSTVHKAQGSTYREVFVDLNNIGQNTRWQEVARLVYVAITRASDKIHVFGELCMNYNKQPPVNLMEGFVDVQAL